MTPESEQHEDVVRVQERLGYRFRDPEWLDRALTHRSYAHEEYRDTSRSYERLEFLGDSLLGFLVAELLLRSDPDANEGVLTRRKQRVVCTDTLATVASGLGLGEELRLGRGEASTGGRAKASLLADVFESILAAVFLDGGVRPARAFVRRHLGVFVRQASTTDVLEEDFKTRLQEATQSRLRSTPSYRIVSREGPDHARTYRVAVRIGKEVYGVGKGSSRKRAEQSAAREALERWRTEHA